MGASWVLPSVTLSTERTINIMYLDIILLLGLILNTMQVTIYTKNIFLILSLYLPNLRKSANHLVYFQKKTLITCPLSIRCFDNYNSYIQEIKSNLF